MVRGLVTNYLSFFFFCQVIFTLLEFNRYVNKKGVSNIEYEIRHTNNILEEDKRVMSMHLNTEHAKVDFHN